MMQKDDVTRAQSYKIRPILEPTWPGTESSLQRTLIHGIQLGSIKKIKKSHKVICKTTPSQSIMLLATWLLVGIARGEAPVIEVSAVPSFDPSFFCCAARHHFYIFLKSLRLRYIHDLLYIPARKALQFWQGKVTQLNIILTQHYSRVNSMTYSSFPPFFSPLFFSLFFTKSVLITLQGIGG